MDSGIYKRRISVIWSADVAGYSRLMGDDEEQTVHTLTRYREIMFDLINQRHGRVVDSPGDNLLAEFASVVDALRCAWDVQQELANKNAELPENRQMRFRIGINLGDVIEEKGRLYGDGVNIAARLESLGDPGGINVSGSAYDQAKNKLPFRFEYTGEQRVKNIQEPVRMYKVVMGSQLAADNKRIESSKRKISWHGRLLLVSACTAVLALGLYIYIDKHVPPLSKKPTTDLAELQKSHGASIAVLPFKNLSGDPEQEYFSDGITEDIITDLSRFHNLLVIASNTVFTYKGKPVNIKTIGQELGVRYVLEGSIQKTGDTVRINAQLVEASNGAHIWAERYERDYEDIFKLQGELVQAIVAKLAIQTFKHEQILAMSKKPQDLQAYDYLLRGWAHYLRKSRASNMLAGEMFATASALDPRYAAAYVGLGWVSYAKVNFGWTEFPDKELELAFNHGRKALELNSANASAHALLCSVYTFQNQYQLAIREAEQAIDLNPNDAYTYNQLGWVLLWSGQVEKAIDALELSLRLDRESPRSVWFHLGMGYYIEGQYKKALDILEKGVVRKPDFAGLYIMLSATYARLGRQEEAVRAAKTLRELDPFFDVETFGTALRNEAHRKAIVEGLRAAGL